MPKFFITDSHRDPSVSFDHFDTLISELYQKKRPKIKSCARFSIFAGKKKYLQFSSRFAILSLTGKPVVGWSKDLGPTERAGSLSAVFYWGKTSERIEHLC
jgi:hypothetical protein